MHRLRHDMLMQYSDSRGIIQTTFPVVATARRAGKAKVISYHIRLSGFTTYTIYCMAIFQPRAALRTDLPCLFIFSTNQSYLSVRHDQLKPADCDRLTEVIPHTGTQKPKKKKKGREKESVCAPKARAKKKKNRHISARVNCVRKISVHGKKES